MALHTSYGDGGFCENCDNTHEHPLYNIVDEYETPDPEPTVEELARQSALSKLKTLGLTDDEIKALIG